MSYTGKYSEQQIIAALVATEGNKTAAAQLLGAHRTTIFIRAKKSPAIADAIKMDGRSTLIRRARSSATKIKDGAMRGPNNPNWRGGVHESKYCFKFNNEFRERVREFFGRVCVECGAPENPKSRLCVHHVNFRKDSCCAEDAAPLFVPLCASCHNKTTYNREYWEERFTALINEQYGGRCYLPRGHPGAHRGAQKRRRKS